MPNQNEEKYIRPTWDEYFMEMVMMVAKRGTCDRGRTGCVITSNKRVVSTGYVGAPIGLPHCDEVGHEMHSVIKEDGKQSRHCIRTSHGEENAIVNAARYGIKLEGATIYCKLAPCYNCAKMIINAGIKRVVAAQDYHGSARSKEIFAAAGIQFNLLSDKMATYADMGPGDSATAQTSTDTEAIPLPSELPKF